MKKNYFSVVSSLILVLSVMAFADNLFFDVDQPSNSDPKFIIHGLCCFAWMIAFVVQANLVRIGRTDLHMRAGVTGFIAGIAMTVSTIYVFVAVWIPWSEMAFFVKANRLFLPSYSLLLLLAWIYRRDPDRHKRMIYMGTLFILLPIIDRSAWFLGYAVHLNLGPFYPLYIILVWNGFFASLFAYDWIVAKNIHPVTYLGLVWFYLVWALAVLT